MRDDADGIDDALTTALREGPERLVVTRSNKR